MLLVVSACVHTRIVPSPVLTVCNNPRRGLLSLTRRPRRLALGTRTNFAQELPRIESEIVVIVPGKLNGVSAHTLRRKRLGVGFENQQRAGSGGNGIARATSRLAALIFAHGARAGIAQVDEAIVRDVAVVPLNIDTGTGREIHLHGFWIGGRGGGLKRGLHGISIAWGAGDGCRVPHLQPFSMAGAGRSDQNTVPGNCGDLY